jgi:transposase
VKKLQPDEVALLRVRHRWQDEAIGAGRSIGRIVVAFEAGRDGFWLARWLRDRGVAAHVIHPVSVAVSREHRRAKTDRLDTELLKRAFLGWLRGEPDHCSMAAIPSVVEEDAKRPTLKRESLVGERTLIVNWMRPPCSVSATQRAGTARWAVHAGGHARLAEHAGRAAA